MFQKALLPVTLKESREDLLSYFTMMSRFNTGEIHLCHVIDSGFAKYDQLSQQIKDYKDWLSEKFPQVQISSEITSGHAASKLLTSANKSQSSFIYLPASRRHRLGKLLLGSTASDVIRLTDLPVFVHKERPDISKEMLSRVQEKHQQNIKVFKEILVAVDFGPNTDRICSSLTEIGNSSEVITYLHVGKRAGDPYSEAKRKEQIQSKLDELKQKFQCNCKEIKTQNKIGIPSKEILQAENNGKTDLIILGKLKVRTPGDLILGSTAERVLKGAHASILIVP